MATPRAKRNTTAVATTDDPFEPVELDPPDPAIARWQELVERDYYVYHDGDAEKYIPFPRPKWSQPDEDQIEACLPLSAYKSEPVAVRSVHSGGQRGVPGTLRPAAVVVTAFMYGTGEQVVNVKTERVYNKTDQWQSLAVNLSPEEVADLIDVLTAALALIGGEA